MEHIVLGSVSGLRNVGQVGWIRSVVGGPGCLFIRVRGGESVRQFARPFEHQTLIVGSIFDHDFFGFCLGLGFSMGHAHQVTIAHEAGRVTRGTHVLVHFVTTTNTGMIKRVQPARVGPFQMRRMKFQVSRLNAGSFQRVKQSTGTTSKHAECGHECFLRLRPSLGGRVMGNIDLN
uniref:Uncharacterized protein n=1 Tax=Cacopsylla melanoneura TaxID=428564 RepID=A0A8D8WQM5_9HEMI